MLEVLRACGDTMLYMMGGSFLFGALFAIFVLIILDMLKIVRGVNPETDAPLSNVKKS